MWVRGIEAMARVFPRNAFLHSEFVILHFLLVTPHAPPVTVPVWVKLLSSDKMPVPSSLQWRQLREEQARIRAG